MTLPESCSFSTGSSRCESSPEFVISIKSSNGEYMIAVACRQHKDLVREKMVLLQQEGDLPEGLIVFEPLSPVGTDCIVGGEDDYVDQELERGIDSDRKI